MYMTTEVKRSAPNYQRGPVFFIFNHLFYYHYIVRVITMVPTTFFIQLMWIFIKCKKCAHFLSECHAPSELPVMAAMRGSRVGLMRSRSPLREPFIHGLAWAFRWSKGFKEARTTIHAEAKVNPKNPSKKKRALKHKFKSLFSKSEQSGEP